MGNMFARIEIDTPTRRDRSIAHTQSNGWSGKGIGVLGGKSGDRGGDATRGIAGAMLKAGFMNQ